MEYLVRPDEHNNDTAHRCFLCPLECGADRAAQRGACGVGCFDPIETPDPYTAALVARAARHYYEEPPISGTRGSGAIFFSGCNMACIFCQNHDISRASKGRLTDPSSLADIMLRLEELGSHNINLVTPSPHTELLLSAIPLARSRGLTVPIVYNTNSYEKVETLKRLEGLIDIYLPDLKYRSPVPAKKYSGRSDYFEIASKAVLEMQRQCGVLETDENGIAVRGLIVRHLVLPGSVDEARGVLDFIHDNMPLETHISLMSQYTPMGENLPRPLERRLLRREYRRALDYCISLGFTNVLAQEMTSAESAFTPEFNGFFE
ncbi:MAG: radical SAM protein [Clostridia bacterium]|nr:radical SAM protein [Clostridia bacterium]